MIKLTENLCLGKHLDPRGLFALPQGYIHVHVYYHYFQTSSSLKAKFYATPPCILLGKKQHKCCLGHMTKMATMPIYAKSLKTSSPKPNDLKTWHAALGTSKFV